MGKPKARSPKILKTNKLKSSIDSNAQKVKENKKNKEQIKKAVKNIDNVLDEEYVRPKRIINTDPTKKPNESKASNNKIKKLVTKPPVKDEVDINGKPDMNKKKSGKITPKIIPEISLANGILDKKVKNVGKLGKEKKVDPKPSPEILSTEPKKKLNKSKASKNQVKKLVTKLPVNDKVDSHGKASKNKTNKSEKFTPKIIPEISFLATSVSEKKVKKVGKPSPEILNMVPEKKCDKSKASKNDIKQLVTKATVEDKVDSHGKHAKGKLKTANFTPKIIPEISSLANGVSEKNVKKVGKLGKENKMEPELSPKILNDSNIKNDRKRKHQENEKKCVEKNNALENKQCKNSESIEISYSTPSSVKRSLIEKAVTALKQYSATTSKSVLFDDDSPVFLQFNLMKIPYQRLNTNFELAHTLVKETSEVCLITNDLKKGFNRDHEPTLEWWNDKLRAANVTKINTVLPFRQLRVEYDQFELKRRLLTQHDFILVDSRLFGHSAHLLGKMFSKSHKLMPVRIDGKDIKKSIDKALKTEILKLKEAATALICVGHPEMSTDHIVDNIEAVVKQLEKKFPGGENNVQALYIKLPQSPALPIYVTLKPNSTVAVPKVKLHLPKAFADFEDELSTYTGNTKVKITPGGSVTVKEYKLPKSEKKMRLKRKKNPKKKNDDTLEDGKDLQDVAKEESDEKESGESDENESEESDENESEVDQDTDDEEDVSDVEEEDMSDVE